MGAMGLPCFVSIRDGCSMWGEVIDSDLRPCSGKQACMYGMLACVLFGGTGKLTKPDSLAVVPLSFLLSCLDCRSTELIRSTELGMFVLVFCRILACAQDRFALHCTAQ